MDQVVIALLVYCAVREVLFMRTVDRLTNKIMSRNYYDLQTSEASAVALAAPKAAPVYQEPEMPTNLAAMQGIGPGF